MSDNIYDFVKSSVEASLSAPPDTDFQHGYLAGLLILAEEALGMRMDVRPFAEAQRLCFSAQYRVFKARRDLANSIRQVEDLAEECD